MNFAFWLGAAAGVILGSTFGYYYGVNWALKKHIIPALKSNTQALTNVAKQMEDLELIEPEDLKDDDDDEEEPPKCFLPMVDAEGEGWKGEPEVKRETVLFRLPDIVVKQYDQSGTLIFAEATFT